MRQMNIPILDSEKILENLKNQKNPFFGQYKAYYSSWLGGIVVDPKLMLLAMDDHMVHRGDAVFEAIKYVNRKVFLLDQHLARLERSAQAIFLNLPFSLAQIKQTIIELLRVANQSDGLIRLFVSRGPGGYTTNPYDSVGSQLYITVTELKHPAKEVYENGVKIGKSKIPVKETWMAQVKSCNYLPNVMMKKESVDRGLHFTVAFDSHGFLAESSTENIALVDSKGTLICPKFENILRGTTMIRAFELIEKQGIKTEQRNIREEELIKSLEVFMIGTTLDVIPVVSYEGNPIGDGKVGIVAKKLLQLVRADLEQGLAF